MVSYSVVLAVVGSAGRSVVPAWRCWILRTDSSFIAACSGQRLLCTAADESFDSLVAADASSTNDTRQHFRSLWRLLSRVQLPSELLSHFTVIITDFIATVLTLPVGWMPALRQTPSAEATAFNNERSNCSHTFRADVPFPTASLLRCTGEFFMALSTGHSYSD